MVVNIMTNNGHMLVDLDAYLPAPATKVRKLFTLMRDGLFRQDRLAVRTYLRDRVRSSNASGEVLKNRQAELEKYIRKLDQDYESIVRQRKEARRQLTSVKGQIRETGKVTASGASWLRMFDEICMGADLYMKDLMETGNPVDEF